MTWIWIIAVLIIIVIGFGLWVMCAAGPKDSLDYQIECLKKEYAKQKRKHEITVRDNYPNKRIR